MGPLNGPLPLNHGLKGQGTAGEVQPFATHRRPSTFCGASHCCSRVCMCVWGDVKSHLAVLPVRIKSLVAMSVIVMVSAVIFNSIANNGQRWGTMLRPIRRNQHGQSADSVWVLASFFQGSLVLLTFCTPAPSLVTVWLLKVVGPLR